MKLSDLKKRLSRLYEKFDYYLGIIGVDIWRWKHRKQLWENSNLNKPPIELDFDPADYEDDIVTDEELEALRQCLFGKNSSLVTPEEEKPVV